MKCHGALCVTLRYQASVEVRGSQRSKRPTSDVVCKRRAAPGPANGNAGTPSQPPQTLIDCGHPMSTPNVWCRKFHFSQATDVFAPGGPTSKPPAALRWQGASFGRRYSPARLDQRDITVESGQKAVARGAPVPTRAIPVPRRPSQSALFLQPAAFCGTRGLPKRD